MPTDAATATFLTTALTEACFGGPDGEPLETTVARYFAPDYQQRTDGHTIDRDGLVEHLRALRAKVAHGRIEVVEVVRQGHRLADRHRVTVTKRDGSVSELEVYMFGELDDDGRLRRVDEVSRVVAGAAEDAELARAR